MAGIAEADETYFLASRKGERHLDRAPRKRGGKAAQRGLSAEQIPVLVCRDRTGRTANFILDKADSKHISIALKPFLPKDLVLCTDGSGALSAAAKKLGVVHQAINLSQGIRVSGVFHIQNVNAFDSRLKEWIRRFHGVATHYLANYLGWRRLLERLPKIYDPSAFLRAALTAPGLQQITGT